MNIFMYDLAREQSWCADYWKRILPDLRGFGYTDIALYVEQRYHFRSIPNHRPLGGITPAQADEARRLCRKHGLQLQWFTNTLGHCDGLLANEQFRYLAEDPGELNQICPTHADTRPLLKNMLVEFAADSRGPFLHVGGDEAWSLNECPRCKKRGLTKAELYLDHYQWVIRETKKLGKRPAMWGDMLLKHPEIIPQIDRDVLIFDWHYDSGSAESIQLFQKHGFEVIPSTGTNEYWYAFFPFDQIPSAIEPFMREARQFGCPGICQTAWEMAKGAVLDNQWERVAAATALYEGKSLRNFTQRFFGSKKADQGRLRALLLENDIARIHPMFRGPHMRRAFLGTDSPYLFYHMNGQPDARPAWDALAKRLPRARKIAESIKRSATKRRYYLELLDLPIEYYEVMYDRIQTLTAIRSAVDCLYPHKKPSAKGMRILSETVRTLTGHIQKCESFAARLEGIVESRGGSAGDVFRLRRQIKGLKTLQGYIQYHERTYKDGVDVPPHELWYV